MLDVMLDLESIGKTADSAIMSIGAVEFDLQTMQMGDKFSRNIHLADSVKHGRKMDPGTVLWWLSQSKDAQDATRFSAEPLAYVLDEFDAWMSCRGTPDEVRVWGNGPSFDNAMLASTYETLGRKPPWRYWNDRCFRTFSAMFPSVKREEVEGVHHKAIDDAVSQVQHLLKIKGVINARRPS